MIQFGDLPPSARGRIAGAWASHAAELRTNPGHWALLCKKDTQGAATAMGDAIRMAKLQAFSPAGSFEATARGFDVWARYVGADQ